MPNVDKSGQGKRGKFFQLHAYLHGEAHSTRAMVGREVILVSRRTYIYSGHIAYSHYTAATLRTNLVSSSAETQAVQLIAAADRNRNTQNQLH